MELLYIRPTLLWIDVGFAISFSWSIALLWAGVPMLLPTLPYVAPVSQFCIAVALAYRVTDVAEDLWLSKLFSQTSTITKTEAEVACRLTQIETLDDLSESGRRTDIHASFVCLSNPKPCALMRCMPTLRAMAARPIKRATRLRRERYSITVGMRISVAETTPLPQSPVG